VAQEALTNAAKHAGASRVDIDLTQTDEAFRLTIKDDGRGFDLAEGARQPTGHGMGLLGMRERVRLLGGEFRITSTKGAGTLVAMSLPMTTPAAPTARRSNA
jgi:signal transduction histidine kinase